MTRGIKDQPGSKCVIRYSEIRKSTCNGILHLRSPIIYAVSKIWFLVSNCRAENFASLQGHMLIHAKQNNFF